MIHIFPVGIFANIHRHIIIIDRVIYKPDESLGMCVGMRHHTAEATIGYVYQSIGHGYGDLLTVGLIAQIIFTWPPTAGPKSLTAGNHPGITQAILRPGHPS